MALCACKQGNLLHLALHACHALLSICSVDKTSSHACSISPKINYYSNKNYNISILLPDAEADPYWEPCYEAISQVENEFSHFGIKIHKSLFKPSSTKSFKKAADAVIDSKPDAILMVPLFYKEAENVAKRCVEADIKIATFNNYIKDHKINFEIGQDLFQSGRVAAKLFNMLLGKSGSIAILHIDEAFQNALESNPYHCQFMEISNSNW